MAGGWGPNCFRNRSEHLFWVGCVVQFSPLAIQGSHCSLHELQGAWTYLQSGAYFEPPSPPPPQAFLAANRLDAKLQDRRVLDACSLSLEG